jgi:hypothetical protein
MCDVTSTGTEREGDIANEVVLADVVGLGEVGLAA